MLVLNFRVSDKNGASAVYREYVVDSNNWKLGRFLKAINKYEDYKNPPFQWQRYQGQIGYCELRYDEGEYNGKKTLNLRAEFINHDSDIDKPFNDDDIPF